MRENVSEPTKSTGFELVFIVLPEKTSCLSCLLQNENVRSSVIEYETSSIKVSQLKFISKIEKASYLSVEKEKSKSEDGEKR